MKDVLLWSGDHPILAILVVWALCGCVVRVVKLVMAPFIARPVLEAIQREEERSE